MATNESNFPEFAHQIDNHDVRAKLLEKLTVLNVSHDLDLSVERYDGSRHLVIAGCGTSGGIVDELADDPQFPLTYNQTYIDGETGDTVTELEVAL